MNKQLIEKLLLNLLNESEQKEHGETKENCFWEIGEKYFIRTVTMHITGFLIAINEKELLLKDAVWIADSGRFHNALKTGELSEVEPFIDVVIINRNSIIDATIWRHELPREAK